MSCLRQRLDDTLSRARDEWELADLANAAAPDHQTRIDVLSATSER